GTGVLAHVELARAGFPARLLHANDPMRQPLFELAFVIDRANTRRRAHDHGAQALRQAAFRPPQVLDFTAIIGTHQPVSRATGEALATLAIPGALLRGLRMPEPAM